MIPFVALLAASVLGLITTLALVPRRPGPGRLPLICLLYASIWWSAGVFLQNLPVAFETRVILGKLVWFAVSLDASFFCFLMWDTTFLGQRPIPRGVWRAAFAYSACVDIIALTNPHHLLYRAITPALGNLGPPHYDRGPIWFCIVLTQYTMLFSTIFYTAWHQRGRSPRRRRIYLGVVMATLATTFMGALNTTRALHLPINDVTPYGFLVVAPLLAWLLIRNQLCDPLPIARAALLDSLPDAVMVLDAERRIVEVNATALALPGLLRRPAGQRPGDLPLWREAINAALDNQETLLPAHIALDPPRFYEVSATSLLEDGMLCGHLVVLRDMTRRQNTENRLRTALEDLNRQLAENIRLQGDLHSQARRDPLTDLLNRRALDETLHDVLSESASAIKPVAVIALDLDHFKAINDAYGHGFGDQVLRAFAALLRSLSRPHDMVFRIGGEEFLAVLPETPLASALQVAERWLHAARAGLQVEDRLLPITFSAGIAVTSGPGQSASMLVADADAAAYRAKRAGRDRIFVHKPAFARPAAG